MLGRAQLGWLEQALVDAQGRGIAWKFVVVSSPIQELGRPSEVGIDLEGIKSWAGGYRFERDSLLQFIDQQAIDNVVFLTTDNHYSQINNLRYHATPGDPSSPRLLARNAIEIISGPIGAGSAYPGGTSSPGLGVSLEGLGARAADRRIVDTLNGDAPSQNPAFRGLKAAGLDPIGLEESFPGLIKESVLGVDGAPGPIEAADFAAYRGYYYAIITVDGPLMTVRVDGIPFDAYPLLDDPLFLARYAARRAQTVISFQLRAQ